MIDETIDLAGPLAHFAEHGYARLGRVVPEAVLADLRTRADDLMLGRVVHPGMFFQHDAPTGNYEDLPLGQGWVGPSVAYRKLEKLEKDPLFRAFLENRLFERVSRAVIGEAITLYRAVLFTKPAGGGTPQPWHQDGGTFWGLDRDPKLQIWTALDDAPVDGGCLEILPGTHLEGLATPLGGVIPEALVRARRADERRIQIPAAAGEVVLLHNYVWHGSDRNRTGRPRRAFTVCLLDAATRCQRKRRAPRQFPPVFERAGA